MAPLPDEFDADRRRQLFGFAPGQSSTYRPPAPGDGEAGPPSEEYYAGIQNSPDVSPRLYTAAHQRDRTYQCLTFTEILLQEHGIIATLRR